MNEPTPPDLGAALGRLSVDLAGTDSWLAVCAQLSADSMAASRAASGCSARVGGALRSNSRLGTQDRSAADLVRTRRVLTLRNVPPAARDDAQRLLADLEHLEDLPLPTTAQVISTRNAVLLGRVDPLDTLRELNTRASRLDQLRDTLPVDRVQDRFRCTYRARTNRFHASVVMAAGESGDQTFASVGVALALAKSELRQRLPQVTDLEQALVTIDGVLTALSPAHAARVAAA